jgi:hypothetical protein
MIAASDSFFFDLVASALFFDDSATPNLIVLAGEVGEGPRPIEDSTEPTVLLALDHPAPDEEGGPGRLASTSVEIPNRLLEAYPGKIERGNTVLVLGRASGAGQVLATSVLPFRSRSA